MAVASAEAATLNDPSSSCWPPNRLDMAIASIVVIALSMRDCSVLESKAALLAEPAAWSTV